MNTAKYFEKKTIKTMSSNSLCILVKLYVKEVLGVAIQNNNIIVILPMLN